MSKPAILVLEDGSCYRGSAFGAPVDAEGEVVFATCMTGYQEVCSDPSYGGQMVVLTYPLIGNYGVTELYRESIRPWVSALIVRERCLEPSNWRSEGDLDSYLKAASIPGIYGVDTRALTRRLRTRGTMRGILTRYSVDQDRAELIKRAQQVTPLEEKDLVMSASTADAYECTDREKSPFFPLSSEAVHDADEVLPGESLRIVVVDYGIKHSIVRNLLRRGARVVVVPHRASASDILSLHPDGIVVGNGPGDPRILSRETDTVRGLLASRIPILGICLGHQMIGQAIGAKIERLKFGHHGGNHPVQDVTTGRVHITAQNHEFSLDAATLPEESGFFVSQINLNDGSVEGLANRGLPIVSVQYHPEGAPGPQDSEYLFDVFLAMVKRHRSL